MNVFPKSHIKCGSAVGLFAARQRLLLFSLILIFLFDCSALRAQNLPDGFVRLRDIDTMILQDIRYFGRHNFLGRRVKGYEKRTCILTRPAAIALHNVQDWLLQSKLSLVVYDCYRPMRAVEDIAAWLKAPGDSNLKGEFYPTFDKSDLYSQKLILRHSAHARGSSVDVAIVPMPILPLRPFDASGGLKPCHKPYGERRQDNALDFGSGFDCFHERSQTNNLGLGATAKNNRRLLVDAMQREGFVNNAQVWWHFTLKGEPFAKSVFDFAIGTKGAFDKGGLRRMIRPVLGPTSPRRGVSKNLKMRPPKPKTAPKSRAYGPVR